MSWGKGGGRGREQHCCCARGFFSWVRTVNVTAHRAAALQGSSELVSCREYIPFYRKSEFAVPSDTAQSSSRLPDCCVSLSGRNLLFMLFREGHWQKRLYIVSVGPAVNSLFCLKHFVAFASLWRTWVPSGELFAHWKTELFFSYKDNSASGYKL